MSQKNIDGKLMIKWMKDLWHYPRSLTGHGTRKTLSYIKNIHPDLNIHSFKSGTKAFDWEIPEEWNIYDAYIEHEIFTGLQICARRSQYEYLTDEDGTLLVDFIGRYENLIGDFYKVIDAIQVPLMLFPKRNMSKERKSQDYKKYFTPLSRKTVERKFEKDLNFFNYEF